MVAEDFERFNMDCSSSLSPAEAGTPNLKTLHLTHLQKIRLVDHLDPERLGLF